MKYSAKRNALLPAIAFSCAIAASTVSPVQAATSLPSGASSLTETFVNWTVSCRVVTKDEAKNVACSMTQQQVDEKGQRALTAELAPVKNGVAGGFILPFGLNLSAGATFQIDESKTEIKSPFSTCLPAGCIVPVNFDAAQTDAVNKGKVLFIRTKALDGQEFKFNVPLEGFSAAVKRIQDLIK